MDLSSLEKLGLTKAEIEVYLMLIREGSSTASRISEKTNLNRSHIYDILTKLTERGFVSVYEMNKVKYFSASNPDKIVDYLKDIESEVEKIMPELKQLKKIKKQEAKVQLFKGKDGLKTILKDIIHEKKDYIVFGDEKQVEAIFPIYFQQFLRDVKNLRLKEKILTRKGFKILKASQSSQVRYLGNEFFSPATTVVYGDKIVTFIWSIQSATLIEDKDVADSFRNYFEALWKFAKNQA